MDKNLNTAELEQSVRVQTGAVTLDGNLCVPERAQGIVVFAHGSGSGRHSRRNRFVAEQLWETGLATLLIDLLTQDEERADQFTGHIRFDIALLADRLIGATDWLAENHGTSHLNIGYFGASTGGGAALVAAAKRPEDIGAVVSRGGRPDLAKDALRLVRAPTLLIVGGDDELVIGLNQSAFELLRATEKEMVIVPGASHLFEEPGKLAEVARLAADWFTRYLHAKVATSID